ncbi:NADH-quinone oxidoreductase subunit F [Fundidesulfovibrio magnetotacticus]|uniref:NADH-quinone oxidoreductase subunit F n=1 Tax=Fundidesulfovibrio magnetotacticus TaxID=2730080 RepID=A0A6V8LQ23_9BACT|nr:NADH-ubiquinone oxidoreductase-F iron-sulfur binding region domain-containing protein [Fundidesulfovibrio magnetotacticus]GFK92448.1 NADH-quinone oxidoreductase subunit F [Fundidesulfovibrio magnetotacticus]
MAEPVLFKHRRGRRHASLEDYVADGGYEGLKKALASMAPAQVIQEVLDSGLRGRGGAGFPAGRKWGGVPPDGEHPRYMQCNADEMEPGTFKDRLIINADPHLLLEGMALGAYAIGASKGIIFIRPSYELEAELLTLEIERAREANFLGRNILGTDFSFDIIVHRSAGRYICGESGAQQRAVMGVRPNPIETGYRSAVRGLWNKPTVVNNVETLAHVPGIVRNGAAWFKGLALTPGGDGTKLFPVSGMVANPGCFELPSGVTLREIIFTHADGMLPGKRFKAALPGGTSTKFIPERLLDMPMDFQSMREQGYRLGTGAVIVFDQDTCLVAATLNMMHYFARESCGWCTPCRDGLPLVLDLLGRIEEGSATREDVAELGRTVAFMDHANCAFAPGAAEPVLALLEHFMDEVEAHLDGKGCPFSAQPALPWRGEPQRVFTWPGEPEGACPGARPRPKPRRIVSCPI